MRKEARLLNKAKAMSSLLLSIDHFNRVSELGRVNAVLILLDHSSEMLIRERGDTNTIGSDTSAGLTVTAIKS